MNLIFLAAVAAASLQTAEPATPVPPPLPQTRLPFATGQLVFTIRTWANGAARCDARGSDVRFEMAATAFCNSASSFSGEGPMDGEPIVEVANVVTLSRDGDIPAPLPNISGQTNFDVEAEVEVAPAGEISACRLLRETRSDRAAPELRFDTYCGDMLLSRLPFQPWAGEGSRRGRVRVTVINSSVRTPSGD